MRLRFDDYTLDVDGGTLFGLQGHLSLSDKPFRLLCVLASAQGRVISKDTAMAAVWPGQIVSDAAFATALKTVRQAIGDNGDAQRLIETVKGRGVRLAVPVFQMDSVALQSCETSDPIPNLAQAPILAILRFGYGDGNQGNPLQQALPADLISVLSNSRELRIISRGSSFQFLSGAVSPIDVNRKCGANYVLSGDIQGPGLARCVRLELSDAGSGMIVWSEGINFSGVADDDLSLELQQRILSVVSREVARNESAHARYKPTELLDAWEAYHLGVTAKFLNTADGNLQAMTYLQQAVTLDPEFSSAYAALSFAAFGHAFNHYGENRAGLLENSIAWADKAIKIDPDNSQACWAKGRSYWAKKAPIEGIHWMDRALELDPNFVLARYTRGVLNNLGGQLDAAHQDLAFAIQLSPVDPMIYSMRGHVGVAYLQQEQFEEGLAWAEHAIRSPRSEHMVMFVAAVAASLAGEIGRARHWKAELAKAAPQITADHFFDSMPLPIACQTAFTKAFDHIT